MAKETNPLIWGAVAGAIGGGAILLAQITGTPVEDNPLLASPASAGAISFFWGWAAGSFKVWYGNHLKRKRR